MNSEDKIVRTSISLPKKLLEEFDSIIEGTRYVSRSEVIRDAMGNFIAEFKGLKEEEGGKVGALMVLYNHEVETASDALTDLQHEHTETILSSVHVHLDSENCLEIIIVKGEAEDIEKLSNQIMGGKGIEEVKLLLVGLPERGQMGDKRMHQHH